MDIDVVDQSSTFVNNMKLPIHRWYRFSAGFSARWCYDLIKEYKKLGKNNIVDPFAGSGTTLLESENLNVNSIGLESHPLIFEIARAKLSWDVDTRLLYNQSIDILKKAKSLNEMPLEYPSLIEKCYPNDSLVKLDKLRTVIESLDLKDKAGRILWLALISILRTCAPVGTANWQYILPNKKKAVIIDPYEAYSNKISQMIMDIKLKQSLSCEKKAKIYLEDARTIKSIPNDWCDLLITSPPYANNYDYADATRLEMSFLRQINGWTDLQNNVRVHLVRSCTQHVSSIVNETYAIIDDPLLTPIKDELKEVCKLLEVERLNHGGKKNYHTMLASYFLDISKILHELRPKCKDGSVMCWVIGDSAPYGIYAPVDKWTGKLALYAGFKNFQFEKTRDRNVKWENRKHRVPLKEGRLWITG